MLARCTEFVQLQETTNHKHKVIVSTNTGEIVPENSPEKALQNTY